MVRTPVNNTPTPTRTPTGKLSLHGLLLDALSLLLQAELDEPGSGLFYFYLFGSVVLIAISALMSGLTVGYMSLDPMNLKILMKQGSPSERKYVDHQRAILQPSLLHFYFFFYSSFENHHVTFVSPQTRSSSTAAVDTPQPASGDAGAGKLGGCTNATHFLRPHRADGRRCRPVRHRHFVFWRCATSCPYSPLTRLLVGSPCVPRGWFCHRNLPASSVHGPQSACHRRVSALVAVVSCRVRARHGALCGFFPFSQDVLVLRTHPDGRLLRLRVAGEQGHGPSVGRRPLHCVSSVRAEGAHFPARATRALPRTRRRQRVLHTQCRRRDCASGCSERQQPRRTAR
jgi:hypothetical protein